MLGGVRDLYLAFLMGHLIDIYISTRSCGAICLSPIRALSDLICWRKTLAGESQKKPEIPDFLLKEKKDN